MLTRFLHHFGGNISHHIYKNENYCKLGLGELCFGLARSGLYYTFCHDNPHCIYDISLSPGDITMFGDVVMFTEDSDLNGASPQFTLTPISTGGPATNVTWTRDSNTVTEGTETVLVTE